MLFFIFLYIPDCKQTEGEVLFNCFWKAIFQVFFVKPLNNSYFKNINKAAIRLLQINVTFIKLILLYHLNKIMICMNQSTSSIVGSEPPCQAWAPQLSAPTPIHPPPPCPHSYKSLQTVLKLLLHLRKLLLLSKLVPVQPR